MMNLDGENGQIIKIDTKSSFLDIREAFVFNEKQKDGSYKGKVVGKVQFQFRCYDKNKPKGQKITQKVDFYLDSEDASYLAEIMRTGRIKSMCTEEKARASAEGKNAAYAFGYVKYGGTASSKVSRQLKFQIGDDQRIWIKALEGPGIVEAKGQIKPNYKDAEATNKIAIPLTEEQIKKIGIALQRALFYFDTWSALGTVEKNVAGFHVGKRQTEEDQIEGCIYPESTGFIPDFIPQYEDYSQDMAPENRF